MCLSASKTATPPHPFWSLDMGAATFGCSTHIPINACSNFPLVYHIGYENDHVALPLVSS
jgi:hypothetical protein